mmetsp:Transcript_21736/g.39005  ORF Transcript_21736/g.39005 Transcript_21736/m.39005 type:complete len:219 (-) Transcript_21736:22-678(-)
MMEGIEQTGLLMTMTEDQDIHGMIVVPLVAIAAHTMTISLLGMANGTAIAWVVAIGTSKCLRADETIMTVQKRRNASLRASEIVLTVTKESHALPPTGVENATIVMIAVVSRHHQVVIVTRSAVARTTRILGSITKTIPRRNLKSHVRIAMKKKARNHIIIVAVQAVITMTRNQRCPPLFQILFISLFETVISNLYYFSFYFAQSTLKNKIHQKMTKI